MSALNRALISVTWAGQDEAPRLLASELADTLKAEFVQGVNVTFVFTVGLIGDTPDSPEEGPGAA